MPERFRQTITHAVQEGSIAEILEETEPAVRGNGDKVEGWGGRIDRIDGRSPDSPPSYERINKLIKYENTKDLKKPAGNIRRSAQSPVSA